MTGQEFIELQKNMGIDVINTKTMSWVHMQNKYAVASPSVEYSYPINEDIKEILSNKNIWFAIFVSEHTTPNTAEYLFEGDDYSIEKFHSKIRNQIRKSLKSCTIKKPTKDDLVKYGFEINNEILGMHQRSVDYLIKLDKWKKYIDALYDARDVYVYAAYVDEEFAAYVFFIKVNDKYYIYHPFATRRFSKQAPMNGLLYTAINDFIEKDKHVTVTYGLASFFTMSGLDKFKKGMLFTEKKMSRVTVLDDKISFFFNKPIHYLFKKLTFIPIIDSLYEKYNILYESSRLYQDYKRNNK